MDEHPAKISLSLADQLACDRTALANERTLLAYLRTSFAFAASGVALLRFVNLETPMQYLAIALCITGAWLLIIGFVRYASFGRRLRALATQTRES